MKIKPFVFSHNRVWRAYQGGALIDRMQGVSAPTDNSFPEEWIASCTNANNHGRQSGEGLSKALVDNKEVLFPELLAEYSYELLGKRHFEKYGASTGYLSKLLDSAIRLPIQAHPDNKAAAELYKSRFGKTEAWIVIATRKINGEKPYLMIGFNEKMDKKLFIQESIQGDMHKSLSMLHRHDVKPGDVLLIKGGTVHAIGPGVLVYEIMEPTDFVVQPECFCGAQRLSDKDRFGELEPEKALEVFNFTSDSKSSAWNRSAIVPVTLQNDDNAVLAMMLDRSKIGFFGAKKLFLRKRWDYENIEDSFCSGSVLDGNVEIVTDDCILKVGKGDSFFMPYSTPKSKFIGNAEIILTFPPEAR